VDHAAAVGVGQGVGHLERHPHRLGRRQDPVAQPRLERAAAQELEHQVGAGLAAPHVEEPDQVGVGEGGDGVGLALELVRGHLRPAGPDHLEGHRPARLDVARLVDHAEGAAPELSPQLVAADAAARAERRRPGVVRAGLRHPRQVREERGELARLGLEGGGHGPRRSHGPWGRASTPIGPRLCSADVPAR